MNRPANLLIAAGLALTCGTGNAAQFEPAQDQQVLAQDLQKLRAPGKVAAVLWTRRTDRCTLQVVFPREYRTPAFVTNTAAALREQFAVAQPPVQLLPKIQAWLLRANGTVIAPAGSSTPAAPGKAARANDVPIEINYSFPLAAADEAVAAVVMIDDDYRIEPLQSFQPGKK